MLLVVLLWLRSRLRLNKYYREEGVFFCFLTNTPQVRDLADELGNHGGRGLLPLKLQLLGVLLLASHEHALLLVLHLAEDVITGYSSHARSDPTTSVDLLDARVLHKLADVVVIFHAIYHLSQFSFFFFSIYLTPHGALRI